MHGGTTELKDGIVTLADGTKELKDGTIKLNDEGISKITKTFKEDAPDAIDKIQETLNNGKKYNSFSGIDKNMSGNVKFILKVQEISNDKVRCIMGYLSAGQAARKWNISQRRVQVLCSSRYQGTGQIDGRR